MAKSREIGARSKWLRVATGRKRGEIFQVFEGSGLFASAQFSFKRAFFPKTTHSEDAEPDNLSMLVYSLHQRIICRFAHEPRGMPAQLGFVAVVAQGMLDRYPDLKVAFLEFGADWLFYVAGRLGHYLPSFTGRIRPYARWADYPPKRLKSISSRAGSLSLPKRMILCFCKK
jgi:hypothetical protein